MTMPGRMRDETEAWLQKQPGGAPPYTVTKVEPESCDGYRGHGARRRFGGHATKAAAREQGGKPASGVDLGHDAIHHSVDAVKDGLDGLQDSALDGACALRNSINIISIKKKAPKN